MFPGFPPEALVFLRALARNNRREWFQPRKETFEKQVRGPMLETVEALNEEFSRFAPEYVNDPKKAVFRIYRDTRFSADKTPYKTHVAAVFRRGGDKLASPALYFAVSAAEVTVAGGVYEPAPEQLLAIRAWLAENHAAFRKVSRGAEKVLGALQGESLQRIPKGFPATHPAADLLKMKRWVYHTTFEAELACSPKLVKEISRRFRAMTPALEMLNVPLASLKKSNERAAAMFTR